MVILGLKGKKVTRERENCLNGQKSFPVFAGNGLIFHTHVPPPPDPPPPQLNLHPVDFKNTKYKLCSPRPGNVCLVSFRCQAPCSLGEKQEDGEVLDMP